jgi:hypothetical protein
MAEVLVRVAGRNEARAGVAPAGLKELSELTGPEVGGHVGVAEMEDAEGLLPARPEPVAALGR